MDRGLRQLDAPFFCGPLPNSIYNFAVLIRRRLSFPAVLLALLICAVAVCAAAQQRPPVQVNVMNVCTPDAGEQAALSAALTQLTSKPAFGPDFEVARGRSTGPEGASDWVRLRREFRRNPVLSNVQFLVTEGGGHTQQKLVFHAKADKIGEILQVSLEAEPGAAPTRMRLERFGSPSLVLARCPHLDQSVYEPLFQAAAERFAAYLAALDADRLTEAELLRLRQAPPTRK